MRQKIIFTLLIVTSLITSTSLGAGIAIAQNKTNSGVVDLTAQYYIESNEIINQQFKGLFLFFEELKKNDPELSDKLFKALEPIELQKNSETGQKFNKLPHELDSECVRNLTSYCLQRKLSNNFLEYLRKSTELSSKNSAVEANYHAEQLRLLSILNNKSVEFYNQVLLVYPLHIQNQEMIQNLEALLANLQQFEASFKTYPNKFHNVTTPACI